ncbi:hypothetical protein NDU88_004562, partial [Pleurodeles waltl]
AKPRGWVGRMSGAGSPGTQSVLRKWGPGCQLNIEGPRSLHYQGPHPAPAHDPPTSGTPI